MKITLRESTCNKHIINKVLSINVKKLSIQTELGIISAKCSASNHLKCNIAYVQRLL